MQKPIKKIGLLLLFIFVLPISAFFIYQFSNLDESEQEINKIYLQQLETILFSVNQYSEDVVNSWVNEINLIFSNEVKIPKLEIESFFANNIPIKNLFITDFKISEFEIYSENENTNLNQNDLVNFLNQNKTKLEKLEHFYKVGYERIESFGQYINSELYLCLFPVKSSSNKIGGFLFNPVEFIKSDLSAKIAQICGEEFTIAIINDSNQEIIHSCDLISVDEIITNKSLWLLSGLTLGVKMKSGNIEDFVSQRYYKNLIILISLFIILLAGITLVYNNIKNELKLTQLKSDFISNVSHELRTPLSLISMYSETLVLDRIKNEEKKREYYSVINNETNRLSKIVNTILNFSKMESGTRKYEFTQCSLADISKDVLRTYDYHIKSKGFSYSEKISNDKLEILADKDAISESIINLVENALKYSDEKKEFEIYVDKNEIGPYWEIKDFGIGISKDDQQKIFDKFYRVSSGLVHKTKGTGLGLSLVKQIMDAHNGEIKVSSKLNEGSTFRLQFRYT